jgi:uncharacterized membrane protein YjjP (DUF1212 family)
MRAQLARRQFNHFAVAVLSAVAASGTYLVASLPGARLGFAFPHPAGFISSVLFLIPGFPLIAGLFDLLHHQTIAAVSRLAYGIMVRWRSLWAQYRHCSRPDRPLAGAASRHRLFTEALTVGGGELRGRLRLRDAVQRFRPGGAGGRYSRARSKRMMLAPAAFFGALVVGVAASAIDRYWHLPRIVSTVPPIIIMVPGLYAYEMIVLFNRGQMLEALQAAASCGFVIGALAMGLATAGSSAGANLASAPPDLRATGSSRPR